MPIKPTSMRMAIQRVVVSSNDILLLIMNYNISLNFETVLKQRNFDLEFILQLHGVLGFWGFGVLRRGAMGFRGAAPWGFEGQRQ